MKKLIPLILILAILAGITMANLGERRVYPLRPGLKYRFTSSRDPNNWWDDVNDVYTMHGLLEVDDINTPKLRVKDVNVTGDLTLQGLTKDRLLYLDNDSNVASVADLSVWIIGTTDQIIVVGADGKVTLSLPQDYDTGATPTLAGLTITGNSVFGLNSSVFQPAAGGDSTTFFQIKNAAGTQVMGFDTSNGRMIIGTGNPTARLHLPAGTATANTAPLKLSSGTNLTTPEAGAIEYDGTHYSVTEVIDRRVLSVASDTIITSTSAASDSETVIYTATISADELHVGKAIIVRAFGDITTNDGAAVVTIRVKIGAVTVVTLPSPARVVSNEPWHLFAFMTIRTVGAGGTVSTHGHIMIEDTEIHTNVSSTALNTTAVNNVTITAQWATADAGDILTIDQGIMEVLN